MPENWYNGTSAYKINEYENYTLNTEKKQQEKKQEQIKHATYSPKRIIVAIALIFAVGIGLLYANVLLIEASAKYDKLSAKLEEVQVRNTQLAFDIASGVNLALVEEKAVTEFGMQQPESYQNVYVDVVQSDFTTTYNESTSDGIVEGLIDGLKSFLDYIS